MKSTASIALLDLHYLPCVEYFATLVQYPVICIEQQENYQKGSYRNRCHLAGANGLLRLSVPLFGSKHQQKAIQEVQIANQQAWQKHHWRSIQSAYGKTPFFEHYAPEIEPLFQQSFEFLFDWNKQLLLQIIESLELPVTLNWSERYHAPDEAGILDLRNSILPKDKPHPGFSSPPYPQAFLERHGFLPNLSILDLLFCLGPQSVEVLEKSRLIVTPK